MVTQCKACEESFVWDDEVIKVESDYYHKNCVDIYPSGWVAFLKDDCGDGYLGETENDDGDMACEHFYELLDDTDDE